MLVASLGLAGCATPGGVRPSREQVPVAVQDLRARQAGSSVVLQFTLPRRARDGTRLEGTWRVEIYRQFVPAGAPSQPLAETAGPPAYSLAANTLANFLIAGSIAFPDSLSPEEFEAHRGERVVYHVRTAVDDRSWSAPSNLAAVILTAPPQPPAGLTATVASGAVILRWNPPAPAPEPSPPLAAYVVYRAEITPEETAAAMPVPVGETAEPAYRDTGVRPGTAYRYTVRSLARQAAGEVESADSTPVVARLQKEFAPAPPSGVVAVAVRSAAGSLEVDVSWAISGEPGVAGYNIYRSEQPGQRGERLNRQPVAATAYRDTTAVPGRTYSYAVTAVGLVGNESEPSQPATISLAPLDPAAIGTSLRPPPKPVSGSRAPEWRWLARGLSRKFESTRCPLEIVPVSTARFRRRRHPLRRCRG